MNDIMKMTKKELCETPIWHNEETWFNGFIVVPTTHVHDSGWQCMKYILLQDRTIIGCYGGSSDVIMLRKQNWHVDCLPKSKLLRFFNIKHYKVSDIIFGSDFVLD